MPFAPRFIRFTFHHSPSPVVSPCAAISADKPSGPGYNRRVSASEIIEELPKLSEAERRAVRERLLQIANQDPEVALCNQSALDGARVLDRMEHDDARRQS